MIKILIIDDDPINVELLEEHLRIEGYESIKSYGGEEGWKILCERSDISLVLLDRMMPGLDGIGFMKMLNKTSRRIPVIMQTAAANQNSVVEGINSGVFYYLTKPFTHDILISIIRSALNDLRYKKDLIDELNKNKDSISLISQIVMKCRTLKDVYDIAYFIAKSYPDPEKVVVGIVELLANAVEHGNLGIGFKRKSELLESGRFNEEVDRRLRLPENRNKYATVTMFKNVDEVVLKIKDCGKGFDHTEFMDLTPDRANKPNGRGLMMTKLISFDEIEYQNDGTEVVCRYKVRDEKSSSNVA